MHNPTYFIDLDGTLFQHTNHSFEVGHVHQKVLPNVRDALGKLDEKGARIILVTGRPKFLEGYTKRQLFEAEIIYHDLIMDVGSGPRILINDRKRTGVESAFGITVERDKGFDIRFINAQDSAKDNTRDNTRDNTKDSDYSPK